MGPKQTFSIGELAREFDVTTRTIRFYEDEGLLQPERRGQVRVYTPADRVKLILILRGKRLGFTLAESREMIGLYDPASGNVTQLERMLDKLVEKRAVLERQLDDIRHMQSELGDVERRCRDALVEAKAAAVAPAANRNPPATAKASPETIKKSRTTGGKR